MVLPDSVRVVLCVSASIVTACAASPEPDPARGARRPNVVLILADDAGYADFGFQQVSSDDVGPLTPAIDSIARDGVVLTDFYVSGSVCSPSRAGLLTGRYQQRFGHELNIPPGYAQGGMSLDEATIADRMREVGYATACVGKWHLGYPDAYHPNERGFDSFYGCLQGSRSYFPYEEPSPHRVLLSNREPTPEQGYVTDRLGAAAARFVREHAHEPFFLFLSFTAPHGPLQAKEEDLERPDIARIEGERRRAYAGLVKAMDDAVGEVLTALDEGGIAGDTLVVFTNDNGGQTRTGAVNTPLRGRKGMLYEGGVRVPFAARWPGRIEAGRRLATPAIALDLAPTFLALAGRPPGEVAAAELDGVDLLPLLTGTANALPERPLFWRSLGRHGPLAVRRGRWKWVWEDRAGAPALFDLVADIGEEPDVSADHPDTARELQALAVAWERELQDPLWGKPTPAPE